MNSRPTVAITGVGSELGGAVARDFSVAGWRVFGSSRAAAIHPGGDAETPEPIDVAELDIADDRAVANWIAGIEARTGHINGLVCAEAIYPQVHFLDQPAPAWDEVLRVNVGGVANACRAVLPGMLRRRSGAIVVVGSLASVRPIAAASAYSASRAALHALVLALSAEIDPAFFPRVRINEYLPVSSPYGADGFGFEPGWQAPHIRRMIADPAFRGRGGFWSSSGPVRLDPSLKATLRELCTKAARRLRPGSRA